MSRETDREKQYPALYLEQIVAAVERLNNYMEGHYDRSGVVMVFSVEVDTSRLFAYRFFASIGDERRAISTFLMPDEARHLIRGIYETLTFIYGGT